MSTPYRVLVTGSRDWADENLISLALDASFCDAANAGRSMVLVHGHCPRGADSMADAWARRMHRGSLPVHIERHPANWQLNGKRAGFIRNAHMVNLGADVVLAFIRNNSRGASHTAKLAEASGIPVRRWEE